jgi:hypothetical protein
MPSSVIEAPRTATAAPTSAGVAVAAPHANQLLRRGIAVIGLAAIALIHLIDGTGKFHEVPYLGWMYMGLVAGCLLVAGMLIERDDRRAWAGAVGLSAVAFLGYALSRTTGLPSAKDDIGNWFEPLGIGTLFAEAVVFGVGLRALVALRSLRSQP